MPQLSQSGVDGLEDSWVVSGTQSMWEGQRSWSLMSAGESKSMGNRPTQHDLKAHRRSAFP